VLDSLEETGSTGAAAWACSICLISGSCMGRTFQKFREGTYSNYIYIIEVCVGYIVCISQFVTQVWYSTPEYNAVDISTPPYALLAWIWHFSRLISV
jgi:hypothetical protein